MRQSPHIEESIKWSVPFYTYYGPLCYFYKNVRDDILLGIYKGTMLTDPAKLLQGTGKQVRHIKLITFADIKENPIEAILQEAMILNEMNKSGYKKQNYPVNAYNYTPFL